MTVEEMIAKADEHLRQTFNQSAAYAQAWLMRADLELRLQERRSAFAATVVEKLNSTFKLYSTYSPFKPYSTYSPPQVVPLVSADGFLITLSNYAIRSSSREWQEHPWGVVLSWALNCTKTIADAGWNLRFAFGGVDEPCSETQGHEFYYMKQNEEEPWQLPIRTPMPYCCRCAAPRSVV